jgi:four helix bundle suffix protein
VREVGRTRPSDQSAPTEPSKAAAYAPWLTHADSTVVANAIICLIHQANYLLDRQIAGLERDFIHEGGYSERLAAARIEERRKQDRADRVDGTDRTEKTEKQAPACPRCSKPMALRTARKGAHAGSQFWGCSDYPECKGVRQIKGSDRSDRSDRSKQGNP